MGLKNSAVESHMNALFGQARANELRSRLKYLSPEDREQLIIEELILALQELGAKYVLPFRFRWNDGSRTSHHLILATKSFEGYELMKEVMAKKSTLTEQGVASFEYNPPDVRFPKLFELSRPLDDLEDMLLTRYAGQTKTFRAIHVEHSVGHPYIERNYKEILLKLEAEGKVQTSPPADRRPKRKGMLTLGETVRITFPKEN